MSTNLTINNLAISGTTTMSAQLTSSANGTFNNITATQNVSSNTATITTLNNTTSNISNLNLSNVLKLIAQYPITFLYNGTSYNIYI